MPTQKFTRWIALTPLALALLAMGCSALSDLGSTADVGIERTAQILDEGIAGLQNNSADWQKVLRDTEGKLTSEAQSTIRNEVSDLLYRGISATSAEVRCDTDFVVNRLRLGLIRIKADLLGAEVPPIDPKLCSVVPLAVDRTLVEQGRLNHLELYGYDLDAGPLQVVLQNSDGEVDVSQVLNLPTHYHMTLTLGGSTGVPITPASQRLIIKQGDQELSTISVIQPVTPICDTQVVTYQPAAVHFIPPKVDSNGAPEGQSHGQAVAELGLIPPLFGGGGSSSGRADADFNGHGPEVKAKVRLINNATSVSAELFMSAKETRGDGTWAQGTRTEQLYIPDSGWRVTNMLVPSVEGGDCPPYSTCFSYVDTNTQPDIFPVGSGPVQRLEFVGDTDGDEAGTLTGMTATFNPLRFELTRTGNCVPPSTVSQLERSGLISPETLEQLAPASR